MSKNRVWYMMGVKGKLSRPAYRGFQKVCRLAEHQGEDIFVTGLSEGTHSMPSLHYTGGTTLECDAWDMRPLIAIHFTSLRVALGDDFDVVAERDHWHIEYDPKV